MGDQESPDRQHLRALLEHHAWANQRILDACRQLPEEGLDAEQPGTFGTIRATLAHLADAERGYVRRLGLSTDTLPDGPTEEMTLDELGELLARSGLLLVDLVQRGAGVGSRPVTGYGRIWQVPVGLLLAQVVNHATEHRTNITTILGSLGADAPETSPWMYFLGLHGVAG